MARDPSLLDSQQPTFIAPAYPAIAHVQLRDLLICPREKGIVNYVAPRAIIEQDIHAPGAPTRVLSPLTFTPNSLTYLPIGQNDTLIAAGGQETEIHLSYHTPAGSSGSSRTRLAWELEQGLTGSINNSVLLTSMSLTRSNESSVDPRVGISNNDGSIRLYDIPLRVQSARRKLLEVGQVRLDVPINHSSISPDGRTLLSVGDSNKVYFHQITGGARISFAPITTLCIPPPDASPVTYSSSSLTAAFSTAFSGDGSKFAVASQEGVVAVWDVRSTKPLKVFQTDKTRGMGGGAGTGNGGASGWLSDDPWEWTRGTKAPGWCVRSVKFNSGEGARLGKEVMAFTEHTSIVHVVDARTFETHDIIRVPTLEQPHAQSDMPSRTASSTAAATSNWHRPTSSIRSTTYASRSNVNLDSAASEQQQIRMRNRNLARRGLPVSNARRTSGLSVPTSSTPSVSSGTQTRNSTTAPALIARSAAATGANDSLHSRASPPPSAWYSSLEYLLPASTSPSPPRATPSSQQQQQRLSAVHPRAPSLDSAAAMVMSTASVPTSEQESATPAGLAARLAPGSAARLAVAASSGRGLMTRRAMSASNTYPVSTPMTMGPSSSPSSISSSGSTPAIVQALGDAFRIPMPASAYSPPASIGDSTWRTLGGRGGLVPDVVGLRRNAISETASDGASGNASSSAANAATQQQSGRSAEMSDEEEDGEGIVVVPDLGDRDVESEVHALLAVHGIPSRLNSRTGSAQHEGGDSAGVGMHDYDDYMEGMGYDDGMHEHEGDDYDRQRYEGMDDRDRDNENPWLFLTPINDERDTLNLPGDEDNYRMDVDEDGEGEEEEDQEEDQEDLDLEFECAPVGNSRSGSPSIRGPMGTSPSSALAFVPRRSVSTSPSTSSRRYGSHSGLGSTPPSSSSSGWRPRPTVSTSSPLENRPNAESTSYGHRRTSSAGKHKNYGYYEELDLAGMCFDPWGERMYVAGVGTILNATAGAGLPRVGAISYGGGYGGVGLGAAGESVGVGAVVEWSIRGAEKRWYVDDGWN